MEYCQYEKSPCPPIWLHQIRFMKGKDSAPRAHYIRILKHNFVHCFSSTNPKTMIESTLSIFLYSQFILQHQHHRQITKYKHIPKSSPHFFKSSYLICFHYTGSFISLFKYFLTYHTFLPIVCVVSNIVQCVKLSWRTVINGVKKEYSAWQGALGARLNN